MCVYRIGIWETAPSLSAGLEGILAEMGFRLLLGSRPAQLAAHRLDLLAIAPDAAGWTEAGILSCGAVLLPGGAGVLARGLRAPCAVSYGPSPRDTLTLSSLEGERLCLSVQRELVTLEGQVVDRQEIPLTLPSGQRAQTVLAKAGVLLLAGVPPLALEETLHLSAERQGLHKDRLDQHHI